MKNRMETLIAFDYIYYKHNNYNYKLFKQN